MYIVHNHIHSVHINMAGISGLITSFFVLKEKKLPTKNVMYILTFEFNLILYFIDLPICNVCCLKLRNSLETKLSMFMSGRN